MDGKDPCAIVPQSDWPKFHIDKPGRFRQQDPTFKSPDCFYGTNIGSVGVTLVVTEGIDKWKDGSRSGVTDIVAPIDGFSVISIIRKGDSNQCGVAVDVATGQYLLADVVLVPSQAAQAPERCEYAHQVAESAMSTLAGS